jgi:hypothetical protein
VPSVCLPAAVGVGTGALGHGEHQLALLRLTGGEHGNLHGLASGVEVGGDGGEVVDGGGHWGCSLWYVAKIRRNGEESKGLSHLLNCPQAMSRKASG